MAQYFDIVSSTINLTKPALSLSKLYRAAQEHETRATVFGYHNETVVINANEIERIWTILVANFGVSHCYVDLVLDLRTLCGQFDVCPRDRLDEDNISRLALQRNLIQYRLLSTIDEAGLYDSWLCRRVTNLIRSSLLMFAICVTFPVECRAPLEILLKEVKSVAERPPGRFEDENPIHLCT